MAESFVRRGHWGHLLLEGGLIIVSILCAFGIEAWWDDHLDRIEEREIIEDLRSEISLNAEVIRRVAARHEDYGQRIRLLNAMSEADALTMPADSVQAYFVTAYAWPTFDPRTGAMDGVVNSGRIEVLSDPDVRSLLADWRRRLDDLREEADLVTRAAERFVSRFSELGPFPWSSDEFSNDQLATLLGNDELIGIARTKVYFGNWYRTELVRTADFADEILAALGSEH